MDYQGKNTLCSHFLLGRCTYSTCFKFHPANIKEALIEYKRKGRCTDLCYNQEEHDHLKCPKLHIDNSVDQEFESLEVSGEIDFIARAYQVLVNDYLLLKSESTDPNVRAPALVKILAIKKSICDVAAELKSLEQSE